jgi:hypothetical protein
MAQCDNTKWWKTWWYRVITQSDTEWRHKVMARTDYTKWLQDEITKRDDTKWWHKVITGRDYTHNLMTQINDTNLCHSDDKKWKKIKKPDDYKWWHNVVVQSDDTK